MLLLIRLLNALGNAGRGIGSAAAGLAEFVHSLILGAIVATGGDLELLKSLLWGNRDQTQVLQAAPPLSPEAQALHAQFEQLIETQYQVGELKRYILTLPALPDEGY